VLAFVPLALFSRKERDADAAYRYPRFDPLVGNLWPLVSPWGVLFDWAEGLARRLGYGDGLELGEPYPEA
jgi:hypothetical protein